MKREAQAVVLGLLGGTVLRISFTDDYLRYVKPAMQPFLIATGVVLIMVAVATLWYELRSRRAAPACADGHDEHREPAVSWLMLAPVLSLLLIAPPALGSYAAENSGSAVGAAEDRSSYPPLPEGDPVAITPLDYASRAIFDEGASLGDRRVLLTGFVMFGPDNTPYLARMTLTCCAADARPIKIGLEGAIPAEARPDTWLEVVGTFIPKQTRDEINDARIPYLAVEQATIIEPPSNQYQ